MKLLQSTAIALALAGTSLFIHAETSQEGKAMLDAAVSELKAKGSDAAIKEFNAGGKWRQGSMYIVVADFKGNVLAHSANDKVVGKNMYEAKDAAGKPFVQDVINDVQKSGDAAVDLRWSNPNTKKIDEGHMVAKRVPGQDAYVGALYFK